MKSMLKLLIAKLFDKGGNIIAIKHPVIHINPPLFKAEILPYLLEKKLQQVVLTI